MNKTRETLLACAHDVAPHLTVTEADFSRNLSDIGFDSLDHAGLLLKVEETFDVKVPDEMVESLNTLDAIAGHVESTGQS